MLLIEERASVTIQKERAVLVIQTAYRGLPMVMIRIRAWKNLQLF